MTVIHIYVLFFGIYLLTPILVREPAVGLIEWLRPKGSNVCSYEEQYAEFKNQTLKNISWYTKCYAQLNAPGVSTIKIVLKWRYPDLKCVIASSIWVERLFSYIIFT